MNNFTRWQIVCRDFSSPQAYCDFGFYYLIAASLQRRVWLGPDYAKLYANPYVILCGEPGIGKGLILKQVYNFLSFHKKYHKEESGEDNSPSLGEAKRKTLQQDPLIIPIGSDSTTWQGLVQEMIEAYDAIPVPAYMENGVKRTNYHHCSLAYVLEELSTIFKKNTEDVANFFLKAYDCEDYTYRTVGRKVDRISKTCMCFMAGTTPSFMQETFDDKILNEGFSSRCWYICADKNRNDNMFFQPLDQEQQIAKIELLLHIKKLTQLYGEVKYSPEAYKFLEEWWPAFRTGKTGRANSSPKLNAYYARLKVHVQKLALAVHFGENADLKYMVVQLSSVKQAISMLAAIEKNMHMALTFRASNPQAIAGRKLIAFLENKKRATQMECKMELHDILDPNLVEDLMAFYISSGKIEGIVDKETATMYYSVKEKPSK